jgi:cation-transporting P-type ATPase I
MGLLDIFNPVLKRMGMSRRRYFESGGRVHLEYRPVPPGALASFARRAEEAFTSLDKVAWAELNPHTRRIVVAFEAGAYTHEQLTRVLEGVEKQADVSTLPFDRAAIDHPADEQPIVRTVVEIGANVVGLGIGAALRLSPFPALPFGANIVGVISVINVVPRLRRAVDRRLGERNAEHLFNVVTPIAFGTSQRHLSPLVDLVYRASLFGEQQARRTVFEEREGELCAAPARAGGPVQPVPGSTRALPHGPVEQYAESAWQVALGAFGISLISTRSFLKALPSLIVGLPKPARLGREVFAAHLGRTLARRGILPLDPTVLRRLDRVDCLVLQGDLVPRERFKLGRITHGAVAFREAQDVAMSLFLADEPLEARRRGPWALGPLGVLGLQGGALPDKLAVRSKELSKAGALVLALARDGEVVALVEVQITPQTGVEELIRAARAAKMRVLVATSDAGALQGFDADDIIPEGSELPRAIRRLQEEGHVVGLVATGASPGLSVADCGVGLCRPGEPPPWGAHLICGEDLSDVRFVLQACLSAREASQQSVRVAVGTAAFGAFVSAGGFLPMDSRRAMLVVNVATLVAMVNGARVSYALERKPLAAPRDPTPWHALEPEGVLARLGTSATGLGAREAARRNRPAAPPTPAIIELGQAMVDEMLNPLVPLLAAGAGMSAFVGSLVDAGMVAGVVGLNAVLGGAQRFQTERAIRVLSRTEQRRAVVLRAGQRQNVEASKLVRGDVVFLQAGDVVPADCRVLDAVSLEVDASSLTGESLPVSKRKDPSFAREVADRSSMLYEGTSIAAGRATAIIVATGGDTEARRGEATGQGVRSRTGVEARLTQLMQLTGPVAAAAGIGLVVTGLARAKGLNDIVGSAVSLAVASVPEGLPLLATAAQLSAAGRLSARGAIVRHPRAIEALGRVDVVCVDKTGTVTQGKVSLARVSDGLSDETADALSPPRRQVLAVALRATPDGVLDAATPEAVDEALLRGATALGNFLEESAPYRRLAELSFEARRGFHAVVGEVGGAGRIMSVKGAPEHILPRCASWQLDSGIRTMDEVARRALSLEVNRFAVRGLRVLAVAERPATEGPIADGDVNDLVFRGFVAFSDPVRPSAALAVAQLRRAGVDVVMVTGDHPSTAEAIAAELDLLSGSGTVTGAELDAMTEGQLAARISSVSIFARVTPSQKVRVVRALQRAGRVVAMAGDGANDAPAIRLADVGVAIGSRSTAAARGAADVILVDERIETLVDAILEGRALWTSVRNAVSVLVGGNLGEIAFTVGAGMIDGDSPLNARQLLLVNLLTDVAPAMAIALRPPPQRDAAALLNEGPDVALGRGLYRDISIRATTTALGAGSAWLIGRVTGSTARARTMGMVALVGTQLAQTVLSGSFTPAVGVATIGSAAVMIAVVQTPVVSQFFGCTPLGPAGWATALASSSLAAVASNVLTSDQPTLPWRFLRDDAPRPMLEPTPEEA